MGSPMSHPPTRGNRTECSGCGESMKKAHRVYRDMAFCGTCYPKEFLRRPCIKCGEPARLHKSEDSGLCRKCTREGWTCLECGRPVERAALIRDGKPVCPACRPHFEPKPVRKRPDGHVTCSVCRKPRRPVNSAGKPLCALCAATDRTEEVAEKDHTYWTTRVIRVADVLGASLESVWCRELFDKFVEYEMARGVDPKALARRLKKRLPPFTQLAGLYTDREDVEASELLTLFPAKEVRRHESVFRFLRQAGFNIPTQEDQRAATELARAAQTIESTERPDHRRLLQNFRNTRYGESSKATAKTIRVALTAACGLLAVAEDTCPTQAELESYLKDVPGQRAAVAAFVGYLKSRGEPLTLPAGTRRGVRATNSSLRACFAMQTHTADYAQLRAAIAGVIVGLVGVPLSAVVALPVSALRAENGTWILVLDGDDAVLDPSLHPGLERYLMLREQWKMSDYLFPGRNPYQHVDVASITHHFERWSVSLRELGMAARADIRAAADQKRRRALVA